MAGKLAPNASAVLAVSAIFFAYVVAMPYFEYAYLEAAAQPGPDDAGMALLPFMVFLFVVISGLPPATVLLIFRVRRVSAYIATGAVSGVLGAFFFVQEFGTMENAGAILRCIPTGDHCTYVVPAFVHLFLDQFRSMVLLVTDIPYDLKHLDALNQLGPVISAGILAPLPLAVCLSLLYWRTSLRWTRQ